MRLELSAERAELISQIDAAYDALEQWTDHLATLKSELIELMGDADEVEYEGETVARYAPAAKPGKFDRDKLKHDYPDIYKAYWHPSPGQTWRFTWRPSRAGSKADYR